MAWRYLTGSHYLNQFWHRFMLYRMATIKKLAQVMACCVMAEVKSIVPELTTRYSEHWWWCYWRANKPCYWHCLLGIFWFQYQEGSLQWRHNGCDGVSNHQPHDCLLNRLFRRRSKKTSKLYVAGLCEGNSPVNSPHKEPVTRKNFHLMTSSCKEWFKEMYCNSGSTYS